MKNNVFDQRYARPCSHVRMFCADRLSTVTEWEQQNILREEFYKNSLQENLAK